MRQGGGEASYQLSICCFGKSIGDNVCYLEKLIVLVVAKGDPIIICSWTWSPEPVFSLGSVEGSRYDAAMAIADETGRMKRRQTQRGAYKVLHTLLLLLR